MPKSGLQSGNFEACGQLAAADWQLTSSYDLWGRGFVSQRFDVGNQFKELLFRDSPVKRRHVSSITGGNLFVGQKDGVAKVTFVSRDYFTPLQWNRLAEYALE